MTLLPVLSLKQAKTYKMSHFFEVTHSKLYNLTYKPSLTPGRCPQIKHNNQFK